MEPKAVSNRASKTQADDLCVGCGMCCDGTFHYRGDLVPEREPQPVSFYKNETFTEGGKSYFRMPCPHFDGQGCSIYEWRFNACQSYKCKLLVRYEKGEIALADAKQVVATAKALIDKVAAHDPDCRISIERQKKREELAESLKRTDTPGRSRISARLLNIIALDEYIAKWIHSRPKKPELANPRPATEGRSD